jgi:polyisoprenyl-phosphate glycosyltransferase
MKISFIIPAFNEESNLIELYRLIKKQPGISEYEREFIFINDGSTDNTLEKIKYLKEQETDIKYISFSRNFGHQVALKAGSSSDHYLIPSTLGISFFINDYQEI